MDLLRTTMALLHAVRSTYCHAGEKVTIVNGVPVTDLAFDVPRQLPELVRL